MQQQKTATQQQQEELNEKEQELEFTKRFQSNLVYRAELVRQPATRQAITSSSRPLLRPASQSPTHLSSSNHKPIQGAPGAASRPCRRNSYRQLLRPLNRPRSKPPVCLNCQAASLSPKRRKTSLKERSMVFFSDSHQWFSLQCPRCSAIQDFDVCVPVTGVNVGCTAITSTQLVRVLHMPSAFVSSEEKQLGNTPLYWSFEAAAEGLQRQQIGFHTAPLVGRL